MILLNNIINEIVRIGSRVPVKYGLWILLLVTVLGVFVPFAPIMPAAGLDPSWVYGINQAYAQGLAFGKDVIFTYGPYASIYTRSYHPATEQLMTWGAVYLAFVYWICLVLLVRHTGWYWIVAYCAILAGLIIYKDSLFFSYPLLAGLLVYKYFCLHENGSIESKWVPFIAALVFSPFGLMPLIKGSLLVICGAIVAISVICSVAYRRLDIAFICFISPVAMMVIFWIAAGQSIEMLPDYFTTMVPIVSGYTEAMATNGKTTELVLYLAASAVLMSTIILHKAVPVAPRLYLLCVYSLFLFISFKAGFVRHDGHAVVSGTSILIAAFLLPFVIKTRTIMLVIAVAALSWGYIDRHYFNTTVSNYLDNVKTTYISVWHGTVDYEENKRYLGAKYDAAVDAIRVEASFPVFAGTTDIYSYNQSYLIASGNVWNPRPALQSYSAYTPELAEADRDHLLDLNAPDNIVFAIEPIDGRLPSIEDGPSWPLLITNYVPFELTDKFIFLRRHADIDDNYLSLITPAGKYVLGENVELPDSSEILYAKIKLKPTLLGRLANILYKPGQLHITLELNNGIKKQYRINSGMVASGFIISPLIQNVAEFGMLYGTGDYLSGNRVRSISVSAGPVSSLFWNEKYSIELSQILIHKPVDLTNLYDFDNFVKYKSAASIPAAKECYGSIDVVNGMSPPPQELVLTGMLQLNGWLAASTEMAVLPEAVYILLQDAFGNRYLLNTRVKSRPDVSAYFKKPELDRSGYAAIAQVDIQEGLYTLGLAMRFNNKLTICTNFNIPVTITR